MSTYVRGRGWTGLNGFERVDLESADLPTVDRAAADAFIRSTTIRFIPDNRVLERCRTLRFDAFTAVSAQLGPGDALWERTARDIGRQRFLAVFVHSGHPTIGLADQRTTLIPGQTCLFTPGTDTAVVHTEHPALLTLFSFEASAVPGAAALVSALPPLGTQTVGAAPVLTAIAAFLHGLLQTPQQPGADVRTLRQLTADVARAILDEAQRAEPPGGSLCDRALQLIRREHEQPACTPAWLATRLGVSRRRLEQSCAAAGVHLADEVRRQRAHTARNALAAHPGWPLARIAETSGFGSVDALRRALQRYHGMSPSQARRSP